MTAATLNALTRARNALHRRWAARMGSLAAALVAAMLAACTSGPPPRVETPQAP
ncbi:MAG TPA: murein transglycosylase, partial [Ralstonia sp.]|nr:murein transglycosylase [Ralstonia sp.]